MSREPADRGSLRVGVTGHRILMELPKIYAGVEAALDRIRAAFPGQPLTIVSSLAEGADRIAAEAVLRAPGSRLVAVIPFELEDYASDFGDEGSPSRVHFDALLARAAEVVQLPTPGERNEGYEQGGRCVLDRCGVLLALWDGQGAQGQGGTGEIVALAREQGKPVVIVRAGNRKPGTQDPTTLGPEQGKVLTERLPEG